MTSYYWWPSASDKWLTRENTTELWNFSRPWIFQMSRCWLQLKYKWNYSTSYTDGCLLSYINHCTMTQRMQWYPFLGCCRNLDHVESEVYMEILRYGICKWWAHDKSRFHFILGHSLTYLIKYISRFWGNLCSECYSRNGFLKVSSASSWFCALSVFIDFSSSTSCQSRVMGHL